MPDAPSPLPTTGRRAAPRPMAHRIAPIVPDPGAAPADVPTGPTSPAAAPAPVPSSPPRPRAAEGSGDGFRPDLEGLRAVAVILVLLYHAGVPGFAGGYVGVDVFFVLSGFLITGLLLRELRSTGTISLPAFYARRLRRLLPAAALALGVTVVLSAWLLPPLRVPDVAADGAAAALYSSNIRFALQATDYLQAELDPSPILHFWSLGVEEQFYLFWPALLLLTAGRRPGFLRRIALVTGGVAASSLLLSLYLTGANAPWAFFSLPTRAWELGMGALLAIAGSRLAAIPARGTAALGWLGLAMVAASGIVIDAGTPFPGTAALLPTVGTALVIAAGVRRPVAAPARILGRSPMRFIGRISYSLYLWHWPILVLPAAALETELPLPVRVGLALLAIPVAAASQRWVEDPIRHGRFVGTLPRRNLAYAGLLTVFVASFSLGIGGAFRPGIPIVGADLSAPVAGEDDPLDDPFGSPFASPGPVVSQAPGSSASPTPVATATPIPATASGPVPAGLRPSLAAVRDDIPKTYNDGCHLDQASVDIGTCAYGDPASHTVVVLFGDSHAAEWFPALERLARDHDWRLVSLTKSACASADATVWNPTWKRAYTECDTWRERALERIASEKPALVIVANSRRYDLVIDGKPVASEDVEARWDAALARTLARLTPIARAVAVIGDTPRSRLDPPVCLSAHLDDALACATPFDVAVNPVRIAGERDVAAAAGATFVDPTRWVCPSEPCPAVIGTYLVYRDQHHITTVLARALAARLGAALPVPVP